MENESGIKDQAKPRKDNRTISVGMGRGRGGGAGAPKPVIRIFKVLVECDNSYYMHYVLLYFVFLLRFFGPVNLMGSCPARSIYLLLGRFSPGSG